MSQRKYNVEVSEILTGQTLPRGLSQLGVHCVISLSNPNYYGKRLEAIFNYLDEHFKKVVIVTSGHLYRHNNMILSNEDADYALSKSLLEEKLYISNEIGNQLNQYERGKFKLAKWSNICLSEEFKESQIQVENFYQQDTNFKQKIASSASTFLTHSRYLLAHNTASELVSDKNTQHCIDFLLEEATMFDYLVKKGYRVGAYPGCLVSALNDIITGQHPLAPYALKTRVNLQLKLKRCGRKRGPLAQPTLHHTVFGAHNSSNNKTQSRTTV